MVHCVLRCLLFDVYAAKNFKPLKHRRVKSVISALEFINSIQRYFKNVALSINNKCMSCQLSPSLALFSYIFTLNN